MIYIYIYLYVYMYVYSYIEVTDMAFGTYTSTNLQPSAACLFKYVRAFCGLWRCLVN